MQSTSFFFSPLPDLFQRDCNGGKRSWEVSALFLHHAFVFFPSSFPWFQIYLGLGLGWKKNKRKDIWLLIWWPLPCLGASVWQMFKVKYFAEHVLCFVFLETSPGNIQEKFFVVSTVQFVMLPVRFRELQLARQKSTCYSCLCFTIWDLPHIGFLCWSLIAPHAGFLGKVFYEVTLAECPCVCHWRNSTMLPMHLFFIDYLSQANGHCLPGLSETSNNFILRLWGTVNKLCTPCFWSPFY